MKVRFMKKLVKVGISNRHVHLTKEVYKTLFSSELTKKKDLTQIGDFAANETVTLKTKKGIIENVRIIGPYRNYNQVEISKSDARKLGLNPPVRKSGDLENSETITIIGEKGEITLENVCILAERHIHLNPSDALNWQVKDGDMVSVSVKGDKSCLLNAHIKVSENGVPAFHIDTDDANAALLNNDEEVEVLL